ncbi:MAG: alanine racemase [Culicoidibacterales bacterium]
MKVLEHRNTWIEVRMDRLKENFQKIEAFTTKELMPVIKANAYGHGAVPVASLYEKLGAKTLVVSAIDEAIELRQAGIQVDILLIGYIAPQDVRLAIDYNVIVSVGSLEWIEQVQKDVFSEKLRIHIKLNCGMNRRGFKKDEEVDRLMKILKDNENRYSLEGIFAHMPVSDTDKEVTEQSITKFRKRVERLAYPFRYIHISNSFTTMNYEVDTSFCNAVRPGVVLYGYYSDDFPISVKPALTLKSRTSEFQTLEIGEKLGYGYTYTANKEMKIAVVPIGYADGILRHFQNVEVYVSNYGASQIVGRICMDYLYVEVPLVTSKEVEIELIGDHVSLHRLAEIQQTIDYEILCQLSPRITRKYIEGENINE